MSTSPSPFRSNILKAISKFLWGAALKTRNNKDQLKKIQAQKGARVTSSERLYPKATFHKYYKKSRRGRWGGRRYLLNKIYSIYRWRKQECETPPRISNEKSTENDSRARAEAFWMWCNTNLASWCPSGACRALSVLCEAAGGEEQPWTLGTSLRFSSRHCKFKQIIANPVSVQL